VQASGDVARRETKSHGPNQTLTYSQAKGCVDREVVWKKKQNGESRGAGPVARGTTDETKKSGTVNVPGGARRTSRWGWG